MSWFRSSQRKPPGARPAERPPSADGPEVDEQAADDAGLERLSPPAPDPESPGQRSSAAPLDFFSLEPEADWEESDDDEDEDEEAEEKAPAKRSSSSSSQRGGRTSARDRSRDRGRDRDRSRSRERRDRAPAADADLADRSLAELHALAGAVGIERYRLLRRPELVAKLKAARAAGSDLKQPEAPGPAGREAPRERGGRRRGGRGRGGRDRRPAESSGEPGREPSRESSRESGEDAPAAAVERLEGMLELMSDGFGFLRVEVPLRSDRDPHVAREQVERFGLRAGDRVAATARPPRRSERNPSVVDVLEVNGRPAAESPERGESFSSLAALAPSERLPLSRTTTSLRMLEVVTPLGKGQRALVRGPGGAGATTLLQQIADGLVNGSVQVIVAVVDARPEELGAWQSSGAELFATSADHAPADQVRAAGLALERSKRLVEEGSDVVLLVDSLTRLARAHALAGGGRHGGGDSEGAPAHEVKRLFAAARATAEGSLTVIAAARSDGDGAIDAELREALDQIANVELRLDPALADAGLYPAIDVAASRTRGEGALVDANERARLDAVRGPARALEGAEAWRYIKEHAGQDD